MVTPEQKKQLINAYKEQMAQGGVCCIRHQSKQKYLILTTADLPGMQNRFRFAVKTKSGCPFHPLRADWQADGPEAFQLEVLDELQQKEGQSRAEFAEDLAVLAEMWREKLDPDLSYEVIKKS